MKRIILLAIAGFLTLVAIGCDQGSAPPASESGKGAAGSKLPPGVKDDGKGGSGKTETPQ